MSDIKTLIVDGLWAKNPALIQLLGICPLLAITTTLVNGLALGIATSPGMAPKAKSDAAGGEAGGEAIVDCADDLGESADWAGVESLARRAVGLLSPGG